MRYPIAPGPHTRDKLVAYLNRSKSNITFQLDQITVALRDEREGLFGPNGQWEHIQRYAADQGELMRELADVRAELRRVEGC